MIYTIKDTKLKHALLLLNRKINNKKKGHVASSLLWFVLGVRKAKSLVISK